MPGWPSVVHGLKRTLLISLLLLISLTGPAAAATLQSSGNTGVEGTVPTSPPSQAPTIAVPSNGQTFNNTPITVSGLCPTGLLIEIFKNGVFAGSTNCNGGSYSLQIDLFEGRNDLIARAYDSLNQASPDSNKVSVTFNSGSTLANPRVFLVTAFAKRGAEPGSSLTWPLTLTGGKGPYAISVDWGDKTAADLISRATAGDFTIEHIYGESGIYKVVIKASDATGDSAYLQVIGVGNGPIQQSTTGGNNTKTVRVIVWWPFLLTVVLVILAFWTGKKHQLEVIRDRLRKGERPFK